MEKDYKNHLENYVKTLQLRKEHLNESIRHNREEIILHNKQLKIDGEDLVITNKRLSEAEKELKNET